MGKVRGHCETNLDEYKREEWPRDFAAVPRKGDQVESSSGKRLTVHSVMHSKRPVGDWGEESYVVLTLHK